MICDSFLINENKNENQIINNELNKFSFKKYLNRALNVCYIGAGYVGGTSSSVMAYKCPIDEVIVTVCDVDIEKINSWNSDNLPIYEPGLEEIVKDRREKNLFFTNDFDRAIYSADIIFISVGTPTKKRGIGAGQAAELSFIEKAVRKIANISRNSKIIVEKSTVPCKTAEHIRAILTANQIRNNNSNNTENASIHFEILSNPEFLSEGTAVNDILYPDRVLIGGLQTKEGIEAQNILSQLYSYWVPEEKIIKMGLWSAELSKLTANALLAQRISSINSLSALCEEIGSDIQEISYACGLDTRIGPKFLNASVGFGGSCFKKDVLNLVYLSNYYKLPEVAEYWNQIITMNEYRKSRFVKNIFKKLFNTISDKTITIFGFSFKKNTKDTRESPAITVVLSLLREGALIKIYDPKVSEKQIKNDIIENCDIQNYNDYISRIKVCSSCYEAADCSNAIVICTEWDEFTLVNYRRIYNFMLKPAFIFDGRLILNHKELKEIGFFVEAIGKKFDF
ncbi:nucleotide sugar dehydrogenase [Neocallimastix californiae]|uniref:UDP-glucose 6-dehydrogenase n=1 Tax=Neocallimastix californiae TaxID=1754190 RepID=A0A1Y1ZU84_9FUNG|nr:nucleotide sugar dehydrogenase [Neocallimastix californiae]|eukprot:ORY13780.1 nucleotide sugar dehydrogenase [Neocallimastix californiae]